MMLWAIENLFRRWRTDRHIRRQLRSPEGIGGNRIRSNGEREYRGYTLGEAVEKAMEIPTLGRWEWLQAWYNADLDDDCADPEGW